MSGADDERRGCVRVRLMEGMGFALNFTGAGGDEHRELEALMERAGPATCAETETESSRQE